ncbi:transposase [Candidatus Sulfotelmatobacter kueseliae]|uniref:Transposase n=1 Tax=Candidatus Sulfotelmatobacter kueseliae TaxID=2042962 RepID=A0A2U3KYE3_9BACT|nr:transposase [Candidatus Sulfotelmatobacter kueseliae]
MDLREQRGLTLAATKKIIRYGDTWKVPSQTGNGFYRVSHIEGQRPQCSCPDWETRRLNCKHIFAAIYVMRREEHSDGSTTVTETIAVATERPTYPQVWPAYNAAQTNEKDTFQSMLADLCRSVEQPQVKRAGRPNLPLPDAIFSAVFKVYSTVSARRFMSDLRDAHAKGFISKTPHFNSILNYLENPDMTPILRRLITQSSLPLQSVETDFAVDSSGFMTTRFVRWFDVKYGKEQSQREWVKCHLICGVKTNIVTAVEIGDKHASDVKFFPPLVEATAHNFTISQVSADKAYGGNISTDAVHKFGGTPFISFRGNATGGVGGTFGQMFHYFMFRREEFLQHYHKRSNVESTFSMMKRKFGDSLRSKTEAAMVNETLCKILCHNLVVLIHEMFELGIEPFFCTKTPNLAQQSLGR